MNTDAMKVLIKALGKRLDKQSNDNSNLKIELVSKNKYRAYDKAKNESVDITFDLDNGQVIYEYLNDDGTVSKTEIHK